MRLDKYISHATGLPREYVKRVIRHKKVTVNGAMTKWLRKDPSTLDMPPPIHAPSAPVCGADASRLPNTASASVSPSTRNNLRDGCSMEPATNQIELHVNTSPKNMHAGTQPRNS